MATFTVEVMELVPRWTRIVIEADTPETAQCKAVSKASENPDDHLWTLGDEDQGPLFVNCVWDGDYGEGSPEELPVLPQLTERAVYFCQQP